MLVHTSPLAVSLQIEGSKAITCWQMLSGHNSPCRQSSPATPPRPPSTSRTWRACPAWSGRSARSPPRRRRRRLTGSAAAGRGRPALHPGGLSLLCFDHPFLILSRPGHSATLWNCKTDSLSPSSSFIFTITDSYLIQCSLEMECFLSQKM